MLTLFFGIIVICVVTYYYILVPLQFWPKKGVKQKGFLTCFSKSWLSLLKRQSVADVVIDFYSEFPGTRYSGSYQFNSPILTLRDPELIKQITVKDFEYFAGRRTYIPEDADPLFGKNLFSLRGKRWRHLRTTISPTFTGSKMRGIFHLIKERVDNFTNYFLKSESEVQSVQFKDISGRWCVDVIASIAFGISVDSLEDQDNEFYKMVSRVMDLTKFSKLLRFVGFLLAPKLYRLFDVKLADKDEDAFFRNLVINTIKEREEKGIIRPDMINLLLQTRHGIKTEEDNTTNETGFAILEEQKLEKDKEHIPISDEDIVAQCFGFFFAGFESVSTLLCCMAHELAVNQDVQDKLREEINQANEKSNGVLRYENLVRLKYLDMVISETLRKWPAQAGAERICTKPYTIQPSTPEESPVDIEEGTVLIIPAFGIQRDPEYFPEPDRFDPERFNDENKHNVVPYSYVPFGAGPRGCIASRLAILEAKIFFYSVLLKFEIIPVEKTCIPLTLVKSPALIAVEGGCWLGLKRIIV